jgi:hypothetical protein
MDCANDGFVTSYFQSFSQTNSWSFTIFRKAIILSTNNKEWLTIPKATVDGSCSSGVNERLSVTFDVNTRSGCMIR